MFLAGCDDIFGASELAGGGSADLEMELADSFPVEHGVEGGHLVYVHLVDLSYFGYFPHGGEGEEVIVLFLCEGEEGDDG